MPNLSGWKIKDYLNALNKINFIAKNFIETYCLFIWHFK